MTSNSAPKVSISCTTYNHEKYISDTLNGFLMQRTDFKFEVLIHDDASSDGTTEIIREYEAKYPDVIKPIYQNENQWSKGIKPTFKYNFPRAKGKYIALCEGDDYWTDPLKLQKQVDFLEANPKYAICFHRVKKVNIINNRITISNKNQKSSTSLDDLAKFNYIYTTSIIFRNYTAQLPNWICNSPIGDYPLHLLNAQYGKIKFLPEIMAVYRIHNKGIRGMKGYKHLFTTWDNMLNIVIGNFKPDINKTLLKQKRKYLFSFLEKALLRFDLKTAKEAYLRLNLSFLYFSFYFTIYQLNKFMIIFKFITTCFKYKSAE